MVDGGDLWRVITSNVTDARFSFDVGVDIVQRTRTVTTIEDVVANVVRRFCIETCQYTHIHTCMKGK